MEHFQLRFADAEELRRVYDEDLRHGRAFVSGLSFAEAGAECELKLYHPESGADLALRARVAELSDEPPGAWLELITTTGLAPFVLRRRRDPEEKGRGGTGQLLARMRKLNAAEQLKVARTGGQQERTALERIYGKAVWEALLSNPRITIPEVARIARKGTAPRPLIDQIADNPAWAKAPPIRRALLSNPRLSSASARRVLKMAPRAEVKLAAKQMAYPATVREIARKIVAGG